MEPKIWGQSAWFFLHSITLNYPDKPNNYDKKIYNDFFNLLPKVLPCNICNINFQKHLNKYPIRFYLDSKEILSKWLVTIHNLTNIECKKPTISYNTFLNEYKKKYKFISYRYLYFLFIILILIYLLYKYFKM